MRKSKRPELTSEQNAKLRKIALEDRNPIDTIKKEFGFSEQVILDLLKSQMTPEKFEIWRKNALAAKPKPKAPKIDDFDEDLDGKYYIKNKFS